MKATRPFSDLEFWSATPTPFLSGLALDCDAVHRLMHHHERLGAQGVMIGGTCGEGPWLSRRILNRFASEANAATEGRVQVSVQVTDNASLQMLERAEDAAKAGASIAVISTPRFLKNDTPKMVYRMLRDTIRQSPLPVGYYDFGNRVPHWLEPEYLVELLAEPNLHIVKDSSIDPERRAIFMVAAAKRGNLRVFTGNEFDIISAIEHGYSGSMLGGGIFNTAIVRRIVTAITEGRVQEAQALQKRMNTLMYRVYGEKIRCWLKGLKHLLVIMGLFSTTEGILEYPLTPEDQALIDEIILGPDADGYRADLFPPTKGN